jgi:hypothetical protein
LNSRLARNGASHDYVSHVSKNLHRAIPKEQAQKLLVTGKTDLLDGFISKRGRRFSAYLKLDDWKVGFEFPERTAGATESKHTI